MTLKDKAEVYKQALYDIRREVETNRVWGGRGWSYHAMPEFRVVRIQNIINKTLYEMDGIEYVEATVRGINKLKDEEEAT